MTILLYMGGRGDWVRAQLPTGQPGVLVLFEECIGGIRDNIEESSK